MWIQRLLLGLLVLYIVGIVKGPPLDQGKPSDIPAYHLPTAPPPLTGIPNIIRYQPVSAPFFNVIFAYIVGYTTNRLIISDGEQIHRCPGGWLKRNKRCYFFSETKASWYGAEAQCRIMGGYLAIPDTEEENNYLKERSRSEKIRIEGGLQHIPHFSRWIGLRSLNGVDITKIITNDSPTFTNFIPPQPENLVINMCIKMEDVSDFTWSSHQCFRTLFYICERPLQTPFSYNI